MATSKAKPYKLKPSDGVMTRDDVSLWEYTMLASCRQIQDWQQFLPPNGQHRDWLPADDDVNHGLEHENANTARKLRNDFANFLTCIATHCPTGFMDTVLRESTSFNSIVKQIRSTFNLDTKGEKFLSIMDIKLDFSPSFTYEQGYMLIKDFCMESLLPVGSNFKNRQLTEPEKLSPLAENFIMKEFLCKVHPKLPEHIKNTKGHLFTNDRPTLACNKATLIDLMDTMLSEIDHMEGLQTANVNINQVGQSRISSTNTRGRSFMRPNPRSFLRGNFRGNINRPNRLPPPSRYSTSGPGRVENCSYCLEARMYDSSKGHNYNNCPFRLGQAIPYSASSQRPYNSGMKVLLIQDPNFIDLAGASIDPTRYQQETNSIQHPHMAAYDDYDYQYAPADIYDENYQEEQL